MKKITIVLSLMVLVILWCADAFAHGVGKCVEDSGLRIAHFAPNTSADPCWGDGCGADKERYEGGHGHIEYADLNGRWELMILMTTA